MISLAEFCERTGQSVHATVDLMRALNDQYVFDMARQEALLQRRGHSRMEARPLQDEGDDYAQVRWRMPGKVFFELMRRKNFGYEGLTSEEGEKDILKAFPQFRVKTVSGRVVGVGFGQGRRRIKTYAE